MYVSLCVCVCVSAFLRQWLSGYDAVRVKMMSGTERKEGGVEGGVR